jgi:signal transduction histidine kinase
MTPAETSVQPAGRILTAVRPLPADIEGPAFTEDGATANWPPELQEQYRRELVLAAERERRRWARNLHDETLQALGALRLGLSVALAVPEQADREAMAVAVAGLEEQIQNLRHLIDDLRPPVLDQLGLGAAVISQIDRVRRGTSAGVVVRLALGDQDERFEPEVELAVFRIVQEALTNASRHADASTIRVAVVRRPRCLEVLVSDDGRGFDVDDPAAYGSGLTGMAEWVALAHGHIEVRSRVGSGTTIEVNVPLPA